MKFDDDDVFVSGFICFAGQMLLYMCCFDIYSVCDNTVIDAMINFTLLYMYTDYYIDNNDVDTATLNSMMMAVQSPDTTSEECKSHPILSELLACYSSILKFNPNSKSALYDLFVCEITTMKRQKNTSLSRHEYMEIAKSKGGLTTLGILSVIDRKNEVMRYSDDVYLIGSIIQLIDDMLDIDIDIKSHINTIATYTLTVDGNLDSIWRETGKRLSDIVDERMKPLTTLLKECLMYTLSRPNNKKYFSSSLYQEYKDSLWSNSQQCDVMSILSKGICDRL